MPIVAGNRSDRCTHVTGMFGDIPHDNIHEIAHESVPIKCTVVRLLYCNFMLKIVFITQISRLLVRVYFERLSSFLFQGRRMFVKGCYSKF